MHIEFIRDSARQMPDISKADEVTSMTIWHCKYRSLAPLAGFTRLKALKIATFADTTLDPLEGLEQLEWLSILHLPKIDDLQPLARLQALTSLALATSSGWDASRKRQVVRSLEPLVSLPRLSALSLFGVVAQDKSLAALERCNTLANVRLSGYPVWEMKRYYAATGVQHGHMPDFPAEFPVKRPSEPF